MKQRDPRLYRSADIKRRSKRPKGKERTEKVTKGRTTKVVQHIDRPKGPPVPWFLVGGLMFSVLLILSVYIGYQYGDKYWIPDLLFLGAVLSAIICAYKALDFRQCHWEDHRTRCQVSVTVLVIIVVVSLIISTYIFTIKEPYNNWGYEAELMCTSGCRAQLPLPMKDKDEAFFMDNDLKVEGPGNARVVKLRYEGKDIVALEVEWSSNLSIKVSMKKDYRILPMGRYGLWNSTFEYFVVVGNEIPDNASFALSFDHQHITREYREVGWSIEGRIDQGVNTFVPKMS